MIDVIAVKHNENGQTFLFQAPQFSGIYEGDIVQVETCKGEAFGTVVATVKYIDTNDEVYKMLIEIAGASTPLKRVKAKYNRSVIEYRGEENGISD